MLAEAPKLDADQEFKRRCLTDTGFFARHVMGYDYDESEEIDELTGGGRVINKGTGGVRAHGPHAEMVAFVDRPDTKPVLMLSPRGSLKSTILQCYAMRSAVRDPTVRILYGMDTYDKAKQKLSGIKKSFESNARLIELFGDMRGDPWGAYKFSLVGANPGSQEYTFQGFGPDKPATGGHYEIVILDDLINHENCKTPEGIEKIMRCFRQVSPLLVPGGKVLVVGTRYFDGDLYEYIVSNLQDHYRILSLDCGMQPEVGDDGVFRLKGTPRYEHLTAAYLTKKLAEMQYAEFCSQYCNKVVTGLHQTFRREHFRPLRWDEDIMGAFSGYIMTDTAVSQQKGACLSIIAYVLFDKQNTTYLADLRVGHFSVPEFVNHFFDLRETWSNRVFHRGECWENIALNTTFRVIVEERAKTLGVRLCPVGLPRTGVAQQKEMRIRKLEPRFTQGRFFVLDTVPRTWTDVTQQRVLWDPEGFLDPEGKRWPDGELVTQFIRFPKYPFNDIPDCLADMDAMDAAGGRMVGFGTPNSFAIRKARGELDRKNKWERGVRVELGIGNKPKPRPTPQDGEWIDKLYADNRRRGNI